MKDYKTNILSFQSSRKILDPHETDFQVPVKPAMREKLEAEAFSLLVFNIPQWLFADLCKIQAARGRPLESLLSKLLEDFVLDNWDLSSDSPRKERWNNEHF